MTGEQCAASPLYARQRMKVGAPGLHIPELVGRRSPAKPVVDQ